MRPLLETNKYLSYLSTHSQYFKKTTHMKTLSAVFFIAFIVFSTKVHSQVNVEPSANALNVIKGISALVKHYTGTAGVTIPLMQISGKEPVLPTKSYKFYGGDNPNFLFY